MSITTAPATTGVDPAARPNHTYEIIESGLGVYTILVNGNFKLTDRYGAARIFTTRNAARKRISRERLGNFHK